MPKKQYPEFVCPECGITFRALDDVPRIYCSVKCKSEATRMTYKEAFESAKIRLTQNSMPEPNSGCILWSGNVDESGYGLSSIGKRRILAHRLSFMIHKGPIPEGMFVCHKCDTPTCINPDHLWIGTNADNMRDARLKGRLKRPRKGVCPKGHPHAVTTGGKRYCPTCTSVRNKLWRQRKEGHLL